MNDVARLYDIPRKTETFIVYAPNEDAGITKAINKFEEKYANKQIVPYLEAHVTKKTFIRDLLKPKSDEGIIYYRFYIEISNDFEL